MKNTSKFSFKVAVLATLGVFGAFAKSEARGPEKSLDGQERKALLKTAAGCTAPQAAIDLDINNVRARIMTAGNQWYDPSTGEARYEIPKGSRKNSLYAGALWVGGFDTQGQLKVTAQLYRADGLNDYWTGPLDAANNIDPATCNLWDRFWKVNRSDVLRFQELVRLYPNPDELEAAVSGQAFDAIREWPARGSITAKGTNDQIITSLASTTREYAPFIDVNGDGKYDYLSGDYPDINGDQYIWRIYNDMGNIKSQTGTLGIGLEIQASAFAFATNDYLNDASFYNYRLINRGNLTLDSCYTSTWTDADLGFFNDDYIGSDTARGLGILYNATAVDGTGQANSYGNQVPMVGVDFFIGPKKFYTDSLGRDTFVKLKMSNFTYFTSNGPEANRDPRNGVEFYRYMTGSNRVGQPFTNDFIRCGTPTTGYGAGPRTTFVFYGDPDKKETWTECCSGNAPGDRRFVHSAGPFRLTGGGVTNDITIGACWASNVGGCPNTNFSKIRLADDAIQELFDNNFRLIEGPEAPRMVAREMDGKVIFYLVNDSNSNNFQEKFGYDLSQARYRVSTAKTRTRGGADSLYKFEGYRVFQLKNNTVRPADIFGEDGEVNQEVAAEVFQSDIKNGINQLVNYTPRSEVTVGNAFQAQVKVNGSDAGIRHSFVVDNDAFALTAQKSLVNYKTYYFVAIAYSANNFLTFDPTNLAGTQDRTYLASSKGQGGIPISVVSVMPNPANGDMGTVLGADYGNGVKITRIAGIGNGGNALQLTPASEDSIMASPQSVVYNPVYTEGAGPASIQVVDPMRLVEADWQLSITGTTTPGFAVRGINPDSGRWELTMQDGSTPVTIFSERNIRTLNEQILEKYGFSVGVKQVLPPGPNLFSGIVYTEENNGLISSDVSVVDPALTWLTGVSDGGTEGENFLNWIRSGSFGAGASNPGSPTVTDWTYTAPSGQAESYDPTKVYEKLLGNNSQTVGTWAPYMLTANRDSLTHAMMPNQVNGPTTVRMSRLQSVDIVYTSDKSKWTRCMVIETGSDSLLNEGRATKFRLRRHAGWNMDLTADGSPIYNGPQSMSWFPGYAISQETGQRLNIFFGEDSYQRSDNGNDMIWNPTDRLLSAFGTPIFGGKHFVWVTDTKYDSCRALYENLQLAENGDILALIGAYTQPIWCGMPMAQAGKLRSLQEGLIPTQTRLRFRVTRPYDRFLFAGQDSVNRGFPLYNFTTRGMAPKLLSDAGNGSDKKALLALINVVPNPYFAYSESYEQSRLDTRVRIINLPRTAEISIYSVDGAMVRRLTKDNPNVSYVDWDLRNAKGLPVGSGMYLMHVRADGIGETILRFFGAIRPVDVTTY